MKANFYLNFEGKTEEAFNFYKSVFGGEFAMVQRMKEVPSNVPGMEKLTDAEKEMIMHIALPIGQGNMLMGTDAIESMGHKLTFGNNISICLTPETEDQAHAVFNALSAGGKVGMPLEKMFWGSLFGSFTDKFGVMWMVNYDYKK